MVGKTLDITDKVCVCEHVHARKCLLPKYVLAVMEIIQKKREMARVAHNTIISVIILRYSFICISSSKIIVEEVNRTCGSHRRYLGHLFSYMTDGLQGTVSSLVQGLSVLSCQLLWAH